MEAPKSITLQSEIIHNTDLVVNTIDGDVVMMSIESGEYFGLNEIGSRIWQLIDGRVYVNVIIEQLLEEFEATYEECEKDTIEFLEQLHDKNIIRVL